MNTGNRKVQQEEKKEQDNRGKREEGNKIIGNRDKGKWKRMKKMVGDNGNIKIKNAETER